MSNDFEDEGSEYEPKPLQYYTSNKKHVKNE